MQRSGEFSGVISVALGPDGSIYGGDPRGRINVFGPDGKVIRAIQVPGIMEIADMVVLPNGNIAVTTLVEVAARPQGDRLSGRPMRPMRPMRRHRLLRRSVAWRLNGVAEREYAMHPPRRTCVAAQGGGVVTTKAAGTVRPRRQGSSERCGLGR